MNGMQNVSSRPSENNLRRWWASCMLLLALLACASGGGAAAQSAERVDVPPLRGVYFNPQVEDDPNFPWLLYYAPYRAQVRVALHDLANTARINLVTVFILIPNTLKDPPRGNAVGQTPEEWANIGFLDNAVTFLEDCHEMGISVEFDLADNRWVPYLVDSEHHIGKPGNPWWPVADDTPWDESAAWYRQVMEYVESHAAHPETIALWCMGGNYQLGGAEPVLWNNDGMPELLAYTERFVNHVWPVFRSAGTRPKAAPYAFPIFSNNAYWMTKPPEERLSGFTNLKRWLVDDLALPPDYWPMSTYPFCDPAPDGIHYLREIVGILGKANATRILSTDLKGPGHEQELRDSIISAQGASGTDILRWHLDKCVEYGFAGWWIWAYQDTPQQACGLRSAQGEWKQDLLRVIQAGAKR